MIRVFGVFMVTVMLLSGSWSFGGSNVRQAEASTTAQSTAVRLKIGDFIKFGSYAGQPVIWRVIGTDRVGQPLLLSDRVLTYKAFDAAGSQHQSAERKSFGSNFYPTSTLRQWLNSTQLNGGIRWSLNAPVTRNLQGGHNPYADEPGFLSDRNFTAAERSLMVPVPQRVLIASADSTKKKGGLAPHVYDAVHVVQNADSAYYAEIRDRVFLLSVVQVQQYVLNHLLLLNDGFIQAEPTINATKRNTDKAVLEDELLSLSDYWLSSAFTGNGSAVRQVNSYNGRVEQERAFAYSGVRPAFYLNSVAAKYEQGGSGSREKPYVIVRTAGSGTSGSGGSGDSSNSLPAPVQLKISEETHYSVTLRWSAPKGVAATQIRGYEVFRNGRSVGTTRSTSYKIGGIAERDIQSFAVLTIAKNGNRSALSGTVKTSPTLKVAGNRVYVNFRSIYLGAGHTPIKTGGEILLPAVPLLEAMGYAVSWNSRSKTMTARKKDSSIQYMVGQSTALLNGKTRKKMVVTPRISKGVLYIPLAFSAKEAGFRVMMIG